MYLTIKSFNIHINPIWNISQTRYDMSQSIWLISYLKTVQYINNVWRNKNNAYNVIMGWFCLD